MFVKVNKWWMVDEVVFWFDVIILVFWLCVVCNGIVGGGMLCDV